MTQPTYLAIPIPRGKTLAIICAVVAVLLAVWAVPLLALPMKVPGGDCGTIFASSKTWKYNSSFDAGTDLQARLSDEGPGAALSSSAMHDAVENSLDDMMADLSFGSAVYDHCKQRHTTRLIWIIALAVLTALAAGASVTLFVRNRNNRAKTRESEMTPPESDSGEDGQNFQQ